MITEFWGSYMPELTNGEKLSAEESYVKGILQEVSGVKVIRERQDEFHQAVLRLEKERTVLMSLYPDKWVAVGKAGVLAVADSMEEVFAEVESKGLSGSEFEVEFLDSNPTDLIL